MKILSDATTTTEVRTITLEDGPVIPLQDGPGVYARTMGGQLQVNRVIVIINYTRQDWKANVYGLKLKGDGTPGKVRGELHIIGQENIPDWLRDIASAAEEQS